MLTYHGSENDPSGGVWEYWLLDSQGPSSVYRNSGSATLVSDDGAGVYPPGIVWFGPGPEGHPDNFGVIRFTVPDHGGGNYRVATAVRCRLDGFQSHDADFHLAHNGVEIFGQDLPPDTATGYTNTLELAAGDTIDFMAGRGPDGTEYGGGLKISATITRLEDTPVRLVAQPLDQTAPEGTPVAFVVTAAGSPAPSLQWYKNGIPIPYATNSLYSIPSAAVADEGARFQVVAANVVSNISYVVTSAVATLTVIADTYPPTLVEVRSVGLESVEVVFSERVSPASATHLAAYILTGPGGPIPILRATLEPAQTKVFLTVGPLAADTAYTLEVHGVEDQSAASNALVSASATFLARPLSVVITEFVAENASGLADADGEFSDWIELQNQTPGEVDLAGWRLTDEPLNPAKWSFPATVLQPAQFLVVFASGKDRRPPGGELHTNFKLDAAGEYLALVRPDGTIAQSLNFGKQHQDVSFGLSGGTNLFLPVPTPGVSNGPGVFGFVADTKFTPNRGFFSNAFSLAITSATAEATIWFTLNGNVPAPGAAGAMRYTNAITLTNTTTVRAAAFLTNFAPTDVDTHTYIFLAGTARQPAAPPGFPQTWDGDPADYGMDQTLLRTALPPYDITNALLSLPAISLVAPFDDLFDAERGIYYNSI
ncbi:MAG TPA: lamin tail domain-containing protein, partial [Candidatus Saccharimonadales bacterium]|nr:lamin tail domain-containing protein [Candidatus Saccharimonadales bacterium]